MMDSVAECFGIQLRYATVKTPDVDRSAKFYESLLGFSRTKTASDYVQVDVGGAELCLDLDTGDELSPQLIFAVDDLAGLLAHFQAQGVDIVATSEADDWVIVHDPDENDVVFERADRPR